MGCSRRLHTITPDMQEASTFTPIKINYESLPGDPSTKWPLVEVKLSTQATKIRQSLYALVDSGSNVSIIHPFTASMLGFTKKDLKMQPGGRSVSGVYKSALSPVEVVTNIYGYTFQLTYTVVDNPNLAFACILGQDSIFQWARLDFQRFKGIFEIKFRKDLH